MSDFEYFFSFFGLLLGLAVAEVALKFADAVDAHMRRPIGVLTPLLAVVVLMDLASLWLWTWSAREIIAVSWPTIFLGLILAVTYFMAASLIFPRVDNRWENLDEHYWARKRLVIGGILLVNLILLLFQFGRALPAWNDAWFFIYQLTYFVPFTALMFSRSRRGDLTILVYLIVMFIVTATDLLPNSEWGNAVDLNPPSTLAPPDIRKL